MKRALLALAALYPLTTQAADLPLLKAAPGAIGYPSAAGWYGGIGGEATVANSSVAGTSLYSAGASFLAVGGYQFRVAGTWAAVEVSAGYQNLGGSQVCSTLPGTCSIGSNWSFSEGIIFGFPWTQVFSYLPALSSIFGTNPVLPLPTGVTPTSSLPYVGGFLDEAQSNATLAALTGNSTGSAWQLTPAIAIGTLNALPNGVVLDTRLKYEFANSSFAVNPGGITANRGSALKAQALFKF